MPARRFFVEGVRVPGDLVEISGSDARKIATVLRLRDGARIEIVDSTGTLFEGDVVLDGDRVRTALRSSVADAAPEERLRVAVAQALPKGQKMDFVVEKATELGAAAIVPFSSERSLAADVGAAKIERWRRLARTASQQSGRRSVAHVDDPLTFERLLERFASYDVVLFPWELAPQVALRERLPALLERARSALIVVGPEGGFSHDESTAATARGAELLWLGPRILRTETAAMALLAIVGAFGG
jgi:16S rRNA (uracil1498-N3)-methyltransferase